LVAIQPPPLTPPTWGGEKCFLLLSPSGGDKGGGCEARWGVLNYYVFYLCNLWFLFKPNGKTHLNHIPSKSLAYCVWIDIIYLLYLALSKSTGLV